MYKSKSEEALRQTHPEDRKRTIQVLKELINSPKTGEDDRDSWKRALRTYDRFAPEVQDLPEHPMFVEFRKRWAYLN
jgi:hypothetical protein